MILRFAAVRCTKEVRPAGVEPARVSPPESKSEAFASFATAANRARGAHTRISGLVCLGVMR
jgi:hypothetical protein